MITVVQLTTAHSPWDVRIFHKECRTLARAGYRVSLIAPHGHDIEKDGVRILGLRAASGRWDRMTRLARDVFRASRQTKAAAFHFHDPELLPLGLLLKLTGRRVFYDVHEDVPKQILHKDWIPHIMRRPISLAVATLELIAARTLDGIVAATPAIGRRFPGAGTVVVQNFPLLGELTVEATMPYRDRPMLAVYIGGIQEVRGAREMVRAIGLLDGESLVRLELAGEIYPPKLAVELTEEPGWERVAYRGILPRPEVAEMLDRARVGLILFHPLPNHVEAQPNKLFEYMSAGIPVVASDFPLWREIVGESHCGLLVDPTDVQAIANAISWLLMHPDEAERMGKAGQAAVRERFNWEVEGQRLVSFYHANVPSVV